MNTQHRLTRVRSGLVLIALATAAALSACGGGTPASGKSGPHAGGGGGRAATLIVGQFRPPTGYIGNPYVTASDPFVSDGIHQLVYEPLFYLNPETGKEEPWLATSFHYDKSFTHLTIDLRHGVTWSDGKSLTSADAVYTMEQIIKTKSTPWRAGNIQASVASARPAGKYAFVLTLKAPNPRFIYTDMSTSIYTSNFTILPKHIFQGKSFKTYSDFDISKGLPVGTGPYRVVSANQTAVTLARNDDWWAAKTGFHKLPAPKKVIFTNPGPEDTAVSRLENNQLDYAGLDVPTVAGFIQAEKSNPKLENWDGQLGYYDACPFSLTINTLQKPWNDPAMRWALNDYINKDQFSEIFNSPGKPTAAETTFPAYPTLEAYINRDQDLLHRYPTLTFDAKKAAAIMQSNGYTQKHGRWYSRSGQPLSLTVSAFNAAALGPSWENADALIQQDLTSAGFAVKMVPGDFNAIAAARAQGVARKASWDLQTWFECGSLNEPWSTLNRYTNALGNDNAGSWDDPQYDAIVKEMGKLPPSNPRIPSLFRKALGIYLSQLPVIPLVQRPEPVIMNRTYWTGWPSAQSPYESPAAWTQYFHQVVLHLQPAQGR